MALGRPSEDEVMSKRGSCGPLAAGVPTPMRPSASCRCRSGISMPVVGEVDRRAPRLNQRERFGGSMALAAAIRGKGDARAGKLVAGKLLTGPHRRLAAGVPTPMMLVGGGLSPIGAVPSTRALPARSGRRWSPAEPTSAEAGDVPLVLVRLGRSWPWPTPAPIGAVPSTRASLEAAPSGRPERYLAGTPAPPAAHRCPHRCLGQLFGPRPLRREPDPPGGQDAGRGGPGQRRRRRRRGSATSRTPPGWSAGSAPSTPPSTRWPSASTPRPGWPADEGGTRRGWLSAWAADWPWSLPRWPPLARHGLRPPLQWRTATSPWCWSLALADTCHGPLHRQPGRLQWRIRPDQ